MCPLLLRSWPVLALSSVLLLLACVAQATIDTFEFDSPDQRALFRSTILELRCPKCQNQSIGDSDAPIAQDIKQKVYEKVTAGESPEAIKTYLVARYGDFVLYRPRLNASTGLLWFGPPLLVLTVLFGLWRWVAKRHRASLTLAAQRAPQQTGLEQAELDQSVEHLLSQYPLADAGRGQHATGPRPTDGESVRGERL